MAFLRHSLVAPSFDVRLHHVLEQAVLELELEWIAVADFDAPTGSAQLRWRAGIPHAPESSPTPENVEGWLASTSPSEPFGLALHVEPALAAARDAVLVCSARRRPPADRLAPLVECLEHGLGEQRRAALAAWVFAAVDSAPDLIEVTDRDARFVYANRAWQQVYGHSPADYLGRTPRELLRAQVDSGGDQAFFQFSLGAIEQGEAWLGTLANRTARGDVLLCEVAVAQFDAGPASFAGNIAVRRRLAHREAREAALMAAHREFRQVLAALPDAVVVLRDDRVYFANAPFLALVERDVESVIRCPFVELLHPDDASAVTGRSMSTTLRFVRPNGSSRVADATVAGAISFEGVASTILLLRDTIEQRLAEERLVHAEKITALGMLAAGVAHEINNPLAYVALSLELLQAEDDDPAQRAALLRDACEGAERIRRIAEGLRSFSAVDQASPAEPVELGKAIGAAVNLTANEIRHRARLVRRDTPALHVLAREGPLVQVLVVVLTNAAQAIPAGTSADHEITIESRPRDAEVEITISDTGVGVPEAVRSRLFDPFTTTKPREKGTGLGLAIAKRIVEEARGSIRIGSRAGGGTTVTITLPRCGESLAPVATLGGGAVAPTAPPAGRVLIIDDDDRVARVAARLLRDHDVTIATDGVAALEALRGGDFGVVLCDLMMPDASGADLYAQAVSMRPALARKFVFMTGGVFTEDAQSFVETVSAEVLSKPFDGVALRESIARVLRAEA